MKTSRSMLTALALSALAVPAMAAIRPCATPITITPGTLTVATTGIAYTQTLTASGGTAYTFSATKGVLPAGVSFTNATATTVDLTGLAAAPGTSVFTVTARNTADGCSGGRTFSLFVNDRTVVTPTPGTTAFTEDAGAVVVDAGVTVTDTDSPNLASATVTITNPQDGAAEVLAATACVGLTVTPGLNSLTVTGSQPPPAYQSCLRSVTYGNSSQNPGVTARVLSFVANDGIASSATANKSVSVARVDDAPVANPISPAAFDEDTPSTITLSYTDPEGDLATACAVTGLTNVTVSTACACTTGVCSVGVTGTSNYNGPASFNYTVTANALTSNSAAASLTINAVADPPVANPITPPAFDEDVAATITLSYTDPDGDQATACAVTAPTNVTVSTACACVAGVCTVGVTGTSNYNGPASFSFTVTANAQTSNSATASLTVTAVNDAPVLGGVTGGFTYTENDAATVIAGALTVTDVDSANLSSATATISAGFQSGQDVLSFTPAGNITGGFAGNVLTLTSAPPSTLAQWQAVLRTVRYNNSSDDPNTAVRTVTFQVNDGGSANNLSNQVSRTITVTAVNDAPSANAFTGQPAQAGIPIAYPAGKLGGTDPEAGTTITIDLVPINVTGATVALAANGGFTLTPLPAATTASFQYRVADNGNPAPGLNSPYVTVSFSVAGPAIYFVKSAAVGLANCTLGNECTLATALTNIGASANARIFISDANSHGNAVPLNSGGWLIGQGVTGTTFDALFGISAPAQGVLATRPSLAQPRPTVANTVTLNVNGVVRGLNISTTTATGITDPAAAITGANVNEVSVSTTTGAAVAFSNATGTFGFTGVTTTGGAGISLTGSNGGSAYSFTGISISSGANAAFAATGGGTVEVTGSTNTLTSTTGTALNVTGTTIGAGGLTFRSIAANGAPNGVVLSGTGAGSLTVTGNSAGMCGGQVANSGATVTPPNAGDCTGGVIQGTSGPGILLTNTGVVSLTRMRIASAGDDGIRGSGVSGFTLASSLVENNGNAVGERGIEMTNLAGTGGISQSTVRGSSETNVLVNNTTATLSSFAVTNSQFATTNFTTGDDGILLLIDGTGAMTASVTQSAFTDNKGDHFQAASTASASGSINLTFSNNTLLTTTANDPNVIGGGITINPGSSADITFTIANNDIQQSFDDAININHDPSSTAASVLRGTITGNTIGTPADAGSGSESSNTITIGAKGAGPTIVAITNNQIRQWVNPYGIFLGATEGSGGLDATVTGNTLSNPDPALALNAIRVDAGATATDNATLCASVTGNNATGAGTNALGNADIRLRQRFSTTIRLPGYGGSASDTAAVNAFVAGNNDPAGATPAPTVSSAQNVGGGGNGFVGGAACALP